MFFSPFFRHAACDLGHMMRRNMLRNEMIMRNELLRAMNAFEALEQEALYNRYNQRHHRDHQGHQRHMRAQEKEALEKERVHQSQRNHRDNRDHYQQREQRNIKAEEKEAQNTKPREAREAKEAQNITNKAKESEVNNMKAKEAEGKKGQESRELRHQHQRRGDVFSEWDNSIDNFFRETSPFGHRYSVFDDFYRPRYDSIGRYAEEMRVDMDKHFKNLENPEAREEYPTLAENDSYFMRVETNNNGHVRVKTIQKAPGTAWETKFEEYKREKTGVEKENKQSIETKESRQIPKENLETSQKKIAEEPQKTSESASSVSA